MNRKIFFLISLFTLSYNFFIVPGQSVKPAILLFSEKSGDLLNLKDSPVLMDDSIEIIDDNNNVRIDAVLSTFDYAGSDIVCKSNDVNGTTYIITKAQAKRFLQTKKASILCSAKSMKSITTQNNDNQDIVVQHTLKFKINNTLKSLSRINTSIEIIDDNDNRKIEANLSIFVPTEHNIACISNDPNTANYIITKEQAEELVETNKDSILCCAKDNLGNEHIVKIEANDSLKNLATVNVRSYFASHIKQAEATLIEQKNKYFLSLDDYNAIDLTTENFNNLGSLTQHFKLDEVDDRAIYFTLQTDDLSPIKIASLFMNQRTRDRIWPNLNQPKEKSEEEKNSSTSTKSRRRKIIDSPLLAIFKNIKETLIKNDLTEEYVSQYVLNNITLSNEEITTISIENAHNKIQILRENWNRNDKVKAIFDYNNFAGNKIPILGKSSDILDYLTITDTEIRNLSLIEAQKKKNEERRKGNKNYAIDLEDYIRPKNTARTVIKQCKDLFLNEALQKNNTAQLSLIPICKEVISESSINKYFFKIFFKLLIFDIQSFKDLAERNTVEQFAHPDKNSNDNTLSNIFKQFEETLDRKIENFREGKKSFILGLVVPPLNDFVETVGYSISTPFTTDYKKFKEDTLLKKQMNHTKKQHNESQLFALQLKLLQKTKESSVDEKSLLSRSFSHYLKKNYS